MAGRTTEGSLWRRAIFESAATHSFLNFCPHVRGHSLRVVKAHEFLVWKAMGRKARLVPERSPDTLCLHVRGLMKAGGEEIGYFAHRNQSQACRGACPARAGVTRVRFCSNAEFARGQLECRFRPFPSFDGGGESV
jgi:hypothetical protein